MQIFRVDGDRLRMMRELRGYSCRGFARKLGIDHSFLSRLERGERDMSPEMIKKVADLLGLPVESLVAKKKIVA